MAGYPSIGQVAELACIMEVLAPKPGNVSPGKPFFYINEMSFVASAAAVGAAFADSAASVGVLAERAAHATWDAVGRNTNLGIILLLTPLVRAAHLGTMCQSAVRDILASLAPEDGAAIYSAIRLFAPEGLGRSEHYDVNGTQIPHLLEAMEHAAKWDSVASEYATGYEITFGLTLPAMRASWEEGYTLRASIQRTFLYLLSRVPDTLIERKLGHEASVRVSAHAADALEAGGYDTPPGKDSIAALTKSLEDAENRMNPGTSADLMAACIFAFLDEKLRMASLASVLDRWDSKRGDRK